MGFGLCFGNIGLGKCDDSEPTSTTFTNDVSLVNSFLEQVTQTVSMNMESTTTASNSASIGDRTIVATVGKNAKLNVGSDVNQTAEARTVQTMTAVLTEILKSNESSDVKLDALATVAQNSESSKLLESASAGNVDIVNTSKTENISTTIKQLSTFLNVMSELSANNNVEIGALSMNVKLQQGAELTLKDKINQNSRAYADQLIDLVNSSETCRTFGVTQDIVSDIEAEQTSKETGLTESLGNTFSKIIGTWLLPVIGVIVAIIIFIVMINMVKAYRIRRETASYGGSWDEEEFEEDF